MTWLFNFPFISSNILASPAYGVYISQLIRYSRACAQYSDLVDGAQLLTQKLLKQRYVAPRLKSSLQKSSSQSGWPFTKYPYLKFYVDVSFLYHCQDFYRTWLYIRVARRVSYKKQELLTFPEHLSSSPVIWWSPCCSSVCVFFCVCVVLLYVFTFWIPYCDVRYDFRIKTIFGSSLQQIVCRRVHVLFTLFVLVCVLWCPTHIVFLLCGFLRIVYPIYVASFSGLSIFDCPFGIL